MRSVLLALVLLVGCKKHAAAPPAEAPNPGVPPAEVKRSQDACQAYIDAACACAKTVPAVDEECKLAKVVPSSIQTAIEVGGSEQASRQDTAQALDFIRKATANCITKTAALPNLGCTPPELH